MIPPNTNELKMHADDLADFGKSLHNLNGTGKALVDAALVVVALIAVMTFLLPPMFA
jgi:hypothetical protein